MNVKPVVLIVDDIPENIQVLMNALKDDYAILAATNGQKALEYATRSPQPDIILLDIMMPEMDGYEVCKRLKSDDATKEIPVIFVTALSDTEDEAKGLELGAIDYITKPISPSLVKSRVHNHIDLKRHRDHLQSLVDERTYQLKLSQEGTIESMGIVAEHRDPETGGHIQRTKEYVRLIATRMAQEDKYKDVLTPEFIELLTNSAPLHDIGKVSISDSILLKPEKLNDEEYEVMKKHSEIGENTIINVQNRLGESVFLNIAKEIAGFHHEKYDGSGYPRGLEGDNIPISGRIMALSDVFDALINKRTYKEAIPLEQALDVIRNERGKHFDPDVVDAFFEVIDEVKKVVDKFKE